tara:strand:+ start:214 stop:1329 length:1116 start_codon:yes stop_codon:yes gene_type:complete
MAVYKIFPSADAFVNTQVVTANAGFDEMLELAGYPVNEVGQTSRSLVRFKTSEIQNVLNNKVGTTPFTASIDLKVAEAYETPATHSVFCYPLAESWSEGVGKFADDISTGSADKSGVSWFYRSPNEADAWKTSSFATYQTASYNDTYPGGCSWYTASAAYNLEATQSFTEGDDFDINIDVTNSVHLHYSGTLDNNGFILKLQDDLEFYTSASLINKYYSRNTNTIYPPSLIISWDDQTYVTGSLTVLDTSQAVIEVTNNRGDYPDEGKYRFRLLSRPKNPTRIFTTGSIYKTNHALPSGSVYGLKDEYTEEMEIPFNTATTKVSCDASGSYIDLFMDGLQPERYYRILIKSELDGSTVIDDSNIFKVVRHG